jgi:L-glyceraldehyde 3-phosphate reductase
MLTDKYWGGIPEGSRMLKDSSLDKELLTDKNLKNIQALNQIALDRGQSLAQMALAWTLRDKRVVSVLIGASSPKQVIENVNATNTLDFTDEELERIDQYAKEGDINLWAESSDYG